MKISSLSRQRGFTTLFYYTSFIKINDIPRRANCDHAPRTNVKVMKNIFFVHILSFDSEGKWKYTGHMNFILQSECEGAKMSHRFPFFQRIPQNEFHKNQWHCMTGKLRPHIKHEWKLVRQLDFLSVSSDSIRCLKAARQSKFF